MKKSAFILIIVLACFTQITLAHHLKLFNEMPDLLLICVILVSLDFDLKSALLFSIFSGVLKDLFSSSGFGFNVLFFSFWSFAVVRLARKIVFDNDLIRVALVAIVSFLHNLLIAVALFAAGYAIPAGVALRILFIGTIFTAVVSFLFFKIKNKVWAVFS